jgi:hypothetical protein
MKMRYGNPTGNTKVSGGVDGGEALCGDARNICRDESSERYT